MQGASLRKLEVNQGVPVQVLAGSCGSEVKVDFLCCVSSVSGIAPRCV